MTFSIGSARRGRIGSIAAIWLVLSALITASRFSANVASAAIVGSEIFINELHYDNSGRDVEELIEVVIPDAWDDLSFLSRMRVTLYNGSSGRPYGPLVALSDFTKDAAGSISGVNFYYRRYSSLQNGSPDGLALSFDFDADGSFEEVQFLSYEGSFIGNGGDADGLVSQDIGVFEPGRTAAGLSLQLGGAGRLYQDFTWQMPLPATKGALNQAQTFASANAVPEPRSWAIWLVVGMMTCAVVRRHRVCRRAACRHSGCRPTRRKCLAARMTEPETGSGTGVT